MGDSHDHTSDPVESNSPIERRTVLRAAGAAGLVPFVSVGAGANETTATPASLPDVMLSNLSNRARTLELRLGTTTSGAGLQTDRTAVSLAPMESTTIDSIGSVFESTIVQTVGETGSATLAISDADDRYDSISIEAGLGDSNRILDVVAYPDEVRLTQTHFDSFGFAGGESQ
ncbi:hypothetical protein [Halovivax limisalsi]|uniref:hypothetical protein n=1 Tax=Halovivax limisalsi TaxID=1453760 RepID=UPI001FFC35B6|nr:hypothetical protein [Halovivax limisalsi]